MIENGLVYIYGTKPTKRFVGCGALIEGGLIATCRHVWDEATRIAGGSSAEQPIEVEVEYPRVRESGAATTSPADLADECDDPTIVDPAPDLVLLQPARIPSAAFPLQLATGTDLETGPGYIHARVRRTDQQDRERWQEAFPSGVINPRLTNEGLRQFTGITGQYWFTSGSSGSPLFREAGQQLAGILSLSELGANDGKSLLHEAFILPATLIRRFAARRAAQPVAENRGLDPANLQPLLDNLQALGIPIVRVPELLKRYIEDASARAAEPAPPFNDGTDIEAVIGASREKLRVLDAQGARDLLQAKINDEEETRTRRLLPLLRERAAMERLTFDYEAAKSTLKHIVDLAPDEVWAWGELGDLWRTTGSLDDAMRAYRGAEAAARRTGDERDLSVSHDRIGDVLVAQGDRAGALTAYRAGLAIAEALARRDPANTEWRHDLFSVSHDRIGDVLVAQGDRAGALTAYRAGLAIREALARRDPANTEWQRDLSVSQNKIGDVLVAQGDRAGALTAYRAGLAIREALARRDPANTEWQRDLSVSHERIGDVLVAQGDRAGALTAYRAGLAIREALARRRPAQHRVAARSLRQPRTGSATCWWRRAIAPGALHGLSRRGMAIRERCRGATRPTPMAARSLGQPRQDRRRAGGAGRRAGALHGLSRRAWRSANARAARPRQHQLAARSLRQPRTGSATCWWRRATVAGALAAYRTGLAIRERAGAARPRQHRLAA